MRTCSIALIWVLSLSGMESDQGWEVLITVVCKHRLAIQIAFAPEFQPPFPLETLYAAQRALVEKYHKYRTIIERKKLDTIPFDCLTIIEPLIIVNKEENTYKVNPGWINFYLDQNCDPNCLKREMLAEGIVEKDIQEEYLEIKNVFREKKGIR